MLVRAWERPSRRRGPDRRDAGRARLARGRARGSRALSRRRPPAAARPAEPSWRRARQPPSQPLRAEAAAPADRDRARPATRSASTTTTPTSTPRFRADPLLGPAIRRVPWLRARRTRLALGGARLGDHRAADRGRAGARDPAADRRPLGRRLPAARPRAAAARRARPGADRRALARPSSPRSTSRPKRAVAMIKVAREVAAGRIDPGPPRARPAPARDQRDRPVDRPGPRPARAAATPTRCRPATSPT